MYFTIWNIFYSSKKQREENYPSLKKRKTPSGTNSRKSVEHTVRFKKQNVRVKVNEKVQ